MNISVIGGDLRIVELVKICIQEGYYVKTFGLEKSELDIYEKSQIKDFQENNIDITEKIIYCESLKQAVEKSDIIITSIPISKDGTYINSIFSDNKILVKDLFLEVKNKKIITGNITDKIKKYINQNNNEIIDVLEFEQLAVLNAIPTAEGAIQIAMEKSKKTIHNSKCLILGFGRIGKVLAKMLTGLGANVFVEARKQDDLSWIDVYGYKKIELKNLNEQLKKEQFDFIFNTIPSLILDENNLKFIDKQCILIDLASKPGGIDFDVAKRLELTAEWALALPGKVAPQTAGKYIFEVINQEIKKI